ncbi:MAG: hypothetical protein RQ751_05670 [Longimicrobiales bacterium]|nr:hypothetical protein [Longimicrobiales bacterium]
MTRNHSTDGTRDAEAAPALPAWLPHTLFAAVTLWLFRDFVFSSAMLYGGDTEAMGYMARAFYAEELARGNFPGWNPLLVGGTPFLAALSGGDSLYPPSLLLLLLMEPYRALGWKLVLHVFLAGVGVYGWTRTLGVSRAAATVAGLGYLVGPFLVTLVFPGHDGKLFVTALTPFLFWAVEVWFRDGSGPAWAGIAAAVAMVTLTTHFQMAYFLFGAAGAYAVFRTVQGIREGKREAGPDGDVPRGVPKAPPAGAVRRRTTPAPRRFVLFLAAAVTGVGVAGVQFLPALQYIGEFSRRTATTTEATPEANRAYAASWSMHPEEALSTLVLPEFAGNDAGTSGWTSGTYWGRNFFKTNHEYLGLGLLLLAVLAFLGGPRPGLRWFLAGLGAVAFLYTLGTHTPVWPLFYALLPGVKLFRAPSMAIFLAGFSLATLAALGVDRFLAWVRDPGTPDGARGLRVLWIGAGALGAVFLLAGSGQLTALWTAVVHSGVERPEALQAAQPFLARGAFLALLVALVPPLLLTGGRRGMLAPRAVVAVLACLVAVDGARISGAFIDTRDFEAFHRTSPNIDVLLARQGSEPPFRVLDLSEPQMGQGVRAAMQGLEVASGHHPNDLARYRELTGMVGSGMPENLLRSPGLMAMLNVRYIIWPVRRFGAPEGLEPVSATRFANGEVYEAVYRVEDLPRARLVAQAEVVPDADAVARLLDPGFPGGTVVTVPEPVPVTLGGGVPEGSVSWVVRQTDRQELTVTTDRTSLLVIADNWYPAWRAIVDGVEAPVLRVNHTLRGIPVEAGTHTVVLTFRSSHVRNGLVVSGLSGLVVLGVLGASLARRRAPAA